MGSGWPRTSNIAPRSKRENHQRPCRPDAVRLALRPRIH